MTDEHLNAERDATDRLRSELACVLGKIMGIVAFKLDNPIEADHLRKVELQLTEALNRHRQEVCEARVAGVTARTTTMTTHH